METIKQALLESYREYGGINHLDGLNLPSQESVDRLAYQLLQLLFPGYFQSETLTREGMDHFLDERLLLVHTNLSNEIHKCRQCGQGEPSEKCSEDEARSVLATFPVIRKLLQTDVEAAYTGDPAARSYEEIILSYPCILAIALYRIAHVLYEKDIPLLPRMLTELAHRRTGIDIHPGATIGSHFFIDHGTGVVIGETTTIGSHVKIYQGVTLGAKSFKVGTDGKIVKGIKRHPDIEDHVTIYSGTSILGGATRIGANSIVGANVWLLDSIPPNSICYYKGDGLVIRSRRTNEAAEG